MVMHMDRRYRKRDHVSVFFNRESEVCQISSHRKGAFSAGWKSAAGLARGGTAFSLSVWQSRLHDAGADDRAETVFLCAGT